MKQYVPIVEGQRKTGLSYKTLKYAAETGQIPAIKTESGQWKICVTDTSNVDTASIITKLDEQQKLLKALCGHLGLPG